MKYEYNNNTLIHSVGACNLQRLESILTYGILSYNSAKNKGIILSKNYLPDNQNQDYISFTRVGDISFTNENNAYNYYVKTGISLIIEDVDYLVDKSNFHNQREDEVLVKDFVIKEKITGIIIPKEFEEYNLYQLDGLLIIPRNITKYEYICTIVKDYILFLKKYHYNIDTTLINDYLKEILYINKALYTLKSNGLENKIDETELKEDYKEVLKELNEFLMENTFLCFNKLLGKMVTLKDIVIYISENKLNIYDIPRNIEPKRY